MPSPACTVKDGAGSPQATTSGYATVTPGNTVTIAVADTTGVEIWAISCVYADETTDPSAIALTVNSATKTATFTAPAAGKSLIFRSVIQNGTLNGRTHSSYATTFKVATLTAGGHVVGAANETLEHNSTYGSTGLINQIIRDASEYLSGTIEAATVSWEPAAVTTHKIVSKSVSVQTTDATTTTLATYALADARVTDFLATITGYRPSNGDSFRTDVVVTYKRFGGGAPSLVGAAAANTNTRSDAGSAAWTATMDVSGNDARVRVTGEASATINWSCELRAQERT